MRKLLGVILALLFIRLIYVFRVNLFNYYTESCNLLKSNVSRLVAHQNGRAIEPLILLLTQWNKNNIWDFKWMGQNNTSFHIMPGCPYRCRFTTNQYRYKGTADMVILDTFYYSRRTLPRRRILKNQKKTGQIWVGYTRESPHTQGKRGIEVDNIFHWIATYRRDADIFWPYATYINRTLLVESSSEAPKINKSKKKKKLVAWLVSHCSTQSKREVLVETLRRYIPVDVYGKCGTPCPAGLDYDCRAYVAANYKFVLAFENSLCTDYVTEKLFYMLKQAEPIVPVTYSWINDTTLAPPNSYIDARDFESIKELADYLQYLDQNDDAYSRYLKWRNDFEIVLHANDNKFCQACGMLLKYKKHLAQGGRRLKRQPSMLRRLRSVGKGGNSSYFKVAGNFVRSTKVCFDPFENKASRNWLLGAE